MITFDAWEGNVPRVWKVAYKAQTGEVLLYGDPSPPHSRTAGWVLAEIGEQVEDLLGRAVTKSFAYSPGERGFIPSFGYKTADFAVIRDCQNPKAVEAVVVGEIGYHGEANFQTILDEVDLWCRSMHPVVIGVKITDNTVLSTTNHPRVEVIVKVTDKQDQVIHVGQGAPHMCAKATDVIEMPSQLFLPTSQRNQRPCTDPIKLDSFSLLQGVRRWVRQRDI